MADTLLNPKLHLFLTQGLRRTFEAHPASQLALRLTICPLHVLCVWAPSLPRRGGFGLRSGALIMIVSVNSAANADVVEESRLAAYSPHQAAHHQVEPEYVQEKEPGNEGKLHVLNGEVNIGAGEHLPAVALDIETVDNVPWEEPEAEVHPGD